VSVLVRPLLPDDLPAVLALEPTLFPYDTWSEATWREELAGVPDVRDYVVAEQAGKVVGYAGLMVSIDQADVLTIGVDPASQGRGVGRALLAALIDAARQRRCADLLLEVRADNRPALRLYESYGFERIARRRGYYTGADGARLDGLVLRLRLSRATAAE
jgi:[ribosomal protein S18]-alanine N-acetyltransferase